MKVLLNYVQREDPDTPEEERNDSETNAFFGLYRLQMKHARTGLSFLLILLGMQGLCLLGAGLGEQILFVSFELSFILIGVGTFVPVMIFFSYALSTKSLEEPRLRHLLSYVPIDPKKIIAGILSSTFLTWGIMMMAGGLGLLISLCDVMTAAQNSASFYHSWPPDELFSSFFLWLSLSFLVPLVLMFSLNTAQRLDGLFLGIGIVTLLVEGQQKDSGYMILLGMIVLALYGGILLCVSLLSTPGRYALLLRFLMLVTAILCVWNKNAPDTLVILITLGAITEMYAARRGPLPRMAMELPRGKWRTAGLFLLDPSSSGSFFLLWGIALLLLSRVFFSWGNKIDLELTLGWLLVVGNINYAWTRESWERGNPPLPARNYLIRMLLLFGGLFVVWGMLSILFGLSRGMPERALFVFLPLSFFVVCGFLTKDYVRISKLAAETPDRREGA